MTLNFSLKSKSKVKVGDTTPSVSSESVPMKGKPNRNVTVLSTIYVAKSAKKN